ncbi:MEDS domain-containing protein [Streptomyces sp. NHF165]|uniref:MEDS domain-containing protein n=1 Tax=Streptomyces sp. NHF165 TaxID=2175864 RepID=UPI001F1A22F6|nr:MEDS domain-containing protein [Streptomyces sp. NHF165]
MSDPDEVPRPGALEGQHARDADPARPAADVRTLPVQRFRPGQHGFASYGSEHPQWDVVHAFVRQGLAYGEKVLVLLHPRVSVGELLSLLDGHGPPVSDAWQRGQVVLSSMRALIAPHRRFTAARQWARLREESARARAEGWTALRAYIDMAWVEDLGADVESVMRRERSSQHLFDSGTYSEICAYDDRAFTDELLAEMHRAHPVNLLGSVGSLHAVRETGADGPQLRLTGEADIATRAELTRALRTALAGTAPGHGEPGSPASGRELRLDLRALHFLGAACAADVLRACAAAPGDATVRCTGVQERILRHLGAGSLRSLTLVVEEGTAC